ncbi:retrovirus-related pol polyprotein from transposon TNT 1-94 [Tanacetum coccineum]
MLNHSEPNQTWGSNAIDIPSSSSLFMTGCLDCTLVSGHRMIDNSQDRIALSSRTLLENFWVLLDSGNTTLQRNYRDMVTIIWKCCYLKVQEVAAPRAEVLANSPVSISINQDDSLITRIRTFSTHSQANVIGDPSRSVSTRKQLETDAMWCYFDAFLTSVEPKNFKQAMTEPSWIDAMQEEIHKFERLKVWELVPCLDKVFLIKLKWIYKVKTDEFGRVLKNKARLVAQGFRQEEGIESISRNHLHRLLE